ncbi:1-aminocyclopropane-1-carboxylate oxidase [Metarhizium album ARSEF 1941]|uniref:1-aminocyclopropane-1-carboxylate oxidase n=1 Tax=Metarhizium album (strain ARSEF 1941) TaxID=1081103 RepID=A0A0B2WUY5_METAS|nr:1-aminocyclopropane-1-carboxylate oxidase [Metarhizium album ARSEF 1941]KHN97454.1 1-aminocyclopropane-1-carboxylate oxidase [Metarhizium album ARSEF 1941]
MPSTTTVQKPLQTFGREAGDFDALPIIDLATLRSPDIQERRELARKIDKACTDVCFFYVKSHGVSEELISATYKAAHRFFSLEEGQKMKYYLGNSTNFRGYSPLYGEKSSNPDLEGDAEKIFPGALSEAFDMGYEIPADLQKSPGHVLPDDVYGLLGKNQWPSDDAVPGLRDAYTRYFGEVLELARALMRVFALALDLEEDFFDPMMEYPGVTSRMLHYPPQPVEGEEVPGLAAHTDDIPALQVRNKHGEWITAPPIPATFIVNISDSLALWFKSTIHRVVNLTGEERYSIPFFFGVDYNTTISVLENQVSEKKPPCCRPFKVGEYVRKKLASAYIGYGGQPAGRKQA